MGPDTIDASGLAGRCSAKPQDDPEHPRTAQENAMNIGSICTRDLVTIDIGASPREAAQLMREHHVGALVVTSYAADGLEVAGLVTDRDLVVEALALPRPLDGLTMKELASRKVLSVSEDADLMTAIDLMQEGGVRRLLVLNGAQAVMGIVSLDDLMSACAQEMGGLAQALRTGLVREVAATTRAPKPAAPLLRFPAMGTAGWSL
jgi:CBS domain-containing protein